MPKSLQHRFFVLSVVFISLAFIDTAKAQDGSIVPPAPTSRQAITVARGVPVNRKPIGRGDRRVIE